METLDRISVFSDDSRTDIGAGTLKIGPDYACIYTPEPVENVLSNRDLRGYSVVASGDGTVRYAGEIVGISIHDTPRQSRTTLRCEPAVHR